jgi:hypothetical protein
MEDSRSYSVYPSDLNILMAFRSFKEYLADNKFKGGKRTSQAHKFRLEVSRYRTLLADDFDEFLKLLEQFPNALPLEIHTKWEKRPNKAFANYIYISKSELMVSVNSGDLMLSSAIHDKLRECFSASNPHQEQMERLSKYEQKKSIFLAHRFDEYGNKQAEILNRFLCRLGFDVKEGSGYEAMDIPEKVAAKIRSQDIFICLVTPGDASWVLSEAAYAKGCNKYLVVVCEADVSFNKGIIGGDYEHLSFPRENIEKCFSDLIYALPV